MAAARDDIEELTLCAYCRRAFDDAEREPKLLACKHHFCLECARGLTVAGEVCCAHCSQRTPLGPGRADLLPTHAPVLALTRRLRSPPRADAREARRIRDELARLRARRRELVLRALDATAALRLSLEAELAADELGATRGSGPELGRLRAALAAAARRARLDDAVRTAAAPLEPAALRRLAAGAAGPAPDPDAEDTRDPLLLLANFLAALACGCGPARAVSASFPLLYLDVEVDGVRWGRVLVEARADVAPRMSRNFAALCTGASGYRGSAVFQCWENESVIAGDVGGRHFLPDESRLSAVRGAVGMRRSQRRRDQLGLVASQFRIVLREMRGFTAIFGCVTEGLELVDRLSRTGDGAGKPHANIVIADCGRLN